MKTRILNQNGWRTIEMPDLVLSEGLKALQKVARDGKGLDSPEGKAALELIRKEHEKPLDTPT